MLWFKADAPIRLKLLIAFSSFVVLVACTAIAGLVLKGTALIGAGLGIGAGLALAYAVTTAFADEGLSFAVPAGALIALVVVATIAGVLAAILPARRASRLDPLTALAYE